MLENTNTLYDVCFIIHQDSPLISIYYASLDYIQILAQCHIHMEDSTDIFFKLDLCGLQGDPTSPF